MYCQAAGIISVQVCVQIEPKKSAQEASAFVLADFGPVMSQPQRQRSHTHLQDKTWGLTRCYDLWL